MHRQVLPKEGRLQGQDVGLFDVMKEGEDDGMLGILRGTIDSAILGNQKVSEVSTNSNG